MFKVKISISPIEYSDIKAEDLECTDIITKNKKKFLVLKKEIKDNKVFITAELLNENNEINVLHINSVVLTFELGEIVSIEKVELETTYHEPSSDLLVYGIILLAVSIFIGSFTYAILYHSKIGFIVLCIITYFIVNVFIKVIDKMKTTE